MTAALSQFDLFGELSRFVLVSLRASGLVAFCPIFGSQLLPVRFRMGMVVGIAVVLFPMASPVPELATGGIAAWGVLGLRELTVGFGLGLAARAVFDGVEGAARLVAGQSGFALSSMLDPLTGSPSVTPALFQGLLVTTLILAADLHHLFIRGLVHSYDVLPPAVALPGVEGLPESASVLGARLFGVAVQLAGPALVVTFAVDLVLVLAGRALPQVPVLMVGYPLKVAAGLVALAVLALVTGTALRWIGHTFTSDGSALLRAFGAS